MVNSIHGKSYPLGVSLYPEGANFCIHSKNAVKVDLLLFDSKDDAKPAQTLTFDPKLNRTFHYWHIFVTGIIAGQIYAYRAWSYLSNTAVKQLQKPGIIPPTR